MNEFTRSLLYVALLVCVPIVTACIKKGIAVAVDAITPRLRTSRCSGSPGKSAMPLPMPWPR